MIRVRFRPIRLTPERTVYKPEFWSTRAAPQGSWRDVFISPFDNVADGKLWARREYGEVEFMEYEPE